MGRGRGSIERERARRAAVTERAPVAYPSARAAATNCLWCGAALYVQPVGRIPKWCSASCRQRAWEQRRAAASGRSAVEVVERSVKVPVDRVRMPRGAEWAEFLRELAEQVSSGRLRRSDLPAIGDELAAVLAAYRRRDHRSRS